MDKKYFKKDNTFYCVGKNNVQSITTLSRYGYYNFQSKITLKEWEFEIENLENNFIEITEQDYKKELKKVVSKIINQL